VRFLKVKVWVKRLKMTGVVLLSTNYVPRSVLFSPKSLFAKPMTTRALFVGKQGIIRLVAVGDFGIDVLLSLLDPGSQCGKKNLKNPPYPLTSFLQAAIQD